MPPLRYQRRPAHLPHPASRAGAQAPHAASASSPPAATPGAVAVGVRLPQPAQGDGALFTFRRGEFAVFRQVEDYGLRELPDLPRPMVLDLGANVGVWSLAALERWPGARVLAVEPHPVTAALLRANMSGLPVEVLEAAVDHPKTADRARLFEGVHASTECSLNDDVRWPHVSQQLDKWVDVRIVDAAELPEAHVLKIDTEGRELPILQGYVRQLCHVRVLLVEPHAVGGNTGEQIERISAIARAAGLVMLPDAGHGLLRYVRR